MTPPPAAFRLPLAALLLGVALALIASGCGEESTVARERGARRPAPNTSADLPTERAAAAGCPKRLDAFVDSLDTLRRQLAVGLAYDDYVARVKDLRADYEEIPVERLTLDCLATGTPAETALNEHIDAANTWGECLADAACATATIEPVLQRKWRIASRHLSEAR